MKKWAIVTGASSGIGKEIATLLAQKGYELMLVSRSLPALTAFGDQLHAAYKVTVDPVALDLAQPDSARRLEEIVAAKGIEVEVLVNNAGVGYWGNFVEQELERLEALAVLNMQTPLLLTHIFAKKMMASGKGYILQVASTAAFLPMPHFALYAATKGFLLQLSQALYTECNRGGVTITTLCPGPTRTSFFDNASFVGKSNRMEKLFGMSSKVVAAAGVKGLFAKKRMVIPGLTNMLSSGISGCVPTSFLLRAMDTFMSK